MYQKINELVENIEKKIVGKRNVVKKIVMALLCNGHVLIEDVPGIGKTQLVLALADSVNGKFNRIQLTPDVMPSDILGFTMIDPQTKEFVYRKGAAMCNFLLADEINRAAPKAQSSLLEVMEERQISMDGVIHRLPLPFLTFATQNPIESYGTYHLPEAQMDRFLMRISIGYPSAADEAKILGVKREEHAKLDAVWTIEDVIYFQKVVEEVKVEDSITDYIIRVIRETRADEHVTLGVSPRGGIALYKAAKANAFMEGRDYVTPNDIRAIASDVLGHRIILSSKGKTIYKQAGNYVEDILNKLDVTSVKEDDYLWLEGK